MDRSNCWETLDCGKETNCAAFPDNGRNCFAVTGTLCKGEKQGSYEEKIAACRSGCDFFRGMMNGVE